MCVKKPFCNKNGFFVISLKFNNGNFRISFGCNHNNVCICSYTCCTAYKSYYLLQQEIKLQCILFTMLILIKPPLLNIFADQKNIFNYSTILSQ